MAQKYRLRAAPGRGRTKSKSNQRQESSTVGISDTHFTMKKEEMNKAPSSFMGKRKSNKILESSDK